MLYAGITKIIKTLLEDQSNILMRDFMELTSLKSPNKISFCKNSSIRLVNNIFNSLKEKFPKYKFLHYSELPIEEEYYDKHYWLYSDLDGVNNFSHAHGLFGLGIALCLGTRILYSGFYMPLFSRFFWTEHDKNYSFLSNYKLLIDTTQNNSIRLITSPQILPQMMQDPNLCNLLIKANCNISDGNNINICHTAMNIYNVVVIQKDDYQSLVSQAIIENVGFVKLAINNDLICYIIPPLVDDVKSILNIKENEYA